ncbi:MAG: CBS domain-containing protein [Candidatus Omnitrophota bacterium]
MKVRDLMTKEVVTVSPEDSLGEVGAILKEKRISGVPVVDQEKKLLGIITITDLLKVLYNVYRWKDVKNNDISFTNFFHKQKIEAKVKEFMAKHIFTLNEDDPIDEVMRVMFDKNAHTIPVMRGDELVGVVGKRDLVRACF